jgi:hypothetical protein
MSTQAQMGKKEDVGKGELIGEIRAKVVSRTIKELTPLGAKLELNGEGGLTGAKINTRHIETVNVFQKMDGTFDWDTKSLETTMEGDIVVGSARGSGKSTGPTTMWGEGEGLLMTQSPRLQWLNGQRTKVELTGDQASGDYQVKIRTA